MRRNRAYSKAKETTGGELKSEGLFTLSPQLLVFAMLLFGLALRLPTVFLPHNETDEVIYLTLADKVSKNPTDYTLQGTPLLSQLPKGTYDQPLFLRPPLFVYLLALFGALGAEVFLPLLAGLGVLWATFAIGKKLARQNNIIVALIACLVLSFCPILLFSSVRILIDVLLALLVSMTVLVFLAAIEKNKKSLFSLAGVMFALAVLTKETAVLIVPVFFYVNFRTGPTAKKLGYLVFYFGIPALLISSPWFFYFHETTGYFFKGSEITDENLKFPFVNMMVHRHWSFYFVHVALLSPVYLFGYFEIVERLKEKKNLAEVIWVLSYFIPLTFYGLSGQGYQTRYILPALPGLALLTADSLYRRGLWAAIVAIILLCYALWTGILNSVLFKLADLFTPFQVMRGSLS